MTITATTVAVNIKGTPLMPQRNVVHDINIAAGLGSIVSGAEIEKPRYKKAWLDAFKARGFTVSNLSVECPISTHPRAWIVDGVETIMTHGSMKKFGFHNPPRFLSVVRLRYVATDEKLGVIATHTINWAYSGLRPFWRIRRTNWDHHFEVQTAKVKELHDAGYPVLNQGDLNRTRKSFGPVKYHPMQVTLVENGLDHIYAVPQPGHKFTVLHRIIKKKGIFTDHYMLAVLFRYDKV